MGEGGKEKKHKNCEKYYVEIDIALSILTRAGYLQTLPRLHILYQN